MLFEFVLALPLLLLAAGRPQKRDNVEQAVLVKAGAGVTLSNAQANLSLTPGQTTTLPFDGSTYTSAIFWAKAGASKTEICTINIPSSKPGHPSITITTQLPYVTVDWGSPAPQTATATCTDPATGTAYLGIPGHAWGSHVVDQDYPYDELCAADYCTTESTRWNKPLSLGVDKTSLETWSLDWYSTFTCHGGSTTTVPAPEIVCTLGFKDEMAIGRDIIYDLLTTAPWLNIRQETLYPDITGTYTFASGICTIVPTSGVTTVTPPAGCSASGQKVLSKSQTATASASASGANASPSARSQASATMVSATSTPAVSSRGALNSLRSASGSASAPTTSDQSPTSVYASASATEPSHDGPLPFLMLHVDSPRIYINSTNTENWWGGMGPFYRNFPFRESTGYLSEGFIISAYDTLIQTVIATRSCVVGVTKDVVGYPTLSLVSTSPFAAQPSETGNAYLHC